MSDIDDNYSNNYPGLLRKTYNSKDPGNVAKNYDGHPTTEAQPDDLIEGPNINISADSAADDATGCRY